MNERIYAPNYKTQAAHRPNAKQYAWIASQSVQSYVQMDSRRITEHALVGRQKCHSLSVTDISPIDINECESNNGNCSQSCTNTNGSYICSCLSGYMLSVDKKTCDGKCTVTSTK